MLLLTLDDAVALIRDINLWKLYSCTKWLWTLVVLTLSAETAGNRLNSNKIIKHTLESLTVELLSQ